MLILDTRTTPKIANYSLKIFIESEVRLYKQNCGLCNCHNKAGYIVVCEWAGADMWIR